MLQTYIIITDPHVHNSAAADYAANIPRLRHLLSTICSKYPGEIQLLLLGDLAHSRRQGASLGADIIAQNCELAKAIFQEFPRIHRHAIPGNHDPYAFINQLNGAAARTDGVDPFFIKGEGHRILMLNSSPTTNGIRLNHGELASDQLDWLAAQLEEARDVDEVVYICMHHPFATKNDSHEGWPGLDELEACLQDHLAQGGKIGAIFSGHFHHIYQWDWHGIPVYSLPPVCGSFVTQPDGGVRVFLETPPAFAELKISDRGRFNLEIGFAPITDGQAQAPRLHKMREAEQAFNTIIQAAQLRP